MLTHALFFLLGLAALVIGAELLVRGASRLALSVGISPLVIGLTIVAFGTSTPELAVSVNAALSGFPDIAIGNVLGSNIANVLLVLGISALITPLIVHEQIIRQEVPIMLGASVIFVAMALDGNISRTEAGILFALVVFYTIFLIVQSRGASRQTIDNFEAEMPPDARWDRHWSVQIALIIVGLVLLVFGANWLVDSATVFARAFGLSDLIIGLTVVAIGTSMPEIATSTIAAVRGERDIAIGNIVGSNVFNLCAVLGLTGLLAPGGIPVSDAARHFDLWIMLAVAFACLPIMLTGREISRWEGGVFVCYYVAYVAWLVLAAQHHAALEAYSGVMLGYVLPLTVITLIVSLMRHNDHHETS